MRNILPIKGGSQARTYRILLENVNPSKIEVKNTDSFQSVEAHTVLLLVNLSSGQEKTIQVSLKEEPNKYRLFYETVSKLQVPLYTTLGNPVYILLL